LIAIKRVKPLMNWVFLDRIDWDYDVTSPLERPLGGSQSALCYLALALAARGHSVTTLTGTTSPHVTGGVRCLSHRNFPPDAVSSEDSILVVVSDAKAALPLRQIVPRQTKLVLWTGLAHDQPAIRGLLDPACAALWDGIVCVSDWQRTMFHQSLHLPLNQLTVLRNAVAPAFERLFQDASDLAHAKSAALRLAYSSTPYRGLDVLVNCFPELRRRHPQCRLHVFSSMQVYGQSGMQDKHQSLYDQCRATEGIDYRGSIPQTQLAGELRAVHVLAYPNTFAETSCIVVMEALAAGCLVVTSDLGGLPETCGGWAKLVPPITPARSRKQFSRDFVEALDAALATMQSDWNAFIQARFEQTEAINSACTWSVRAAEWEAAAARWLQAHA